MKKLLFIILIPLLLFSCQNEDTNPEFRPLLDKLEGVWQWSGSFHSELNQSLAPTTDLVFSNVHINEHRFSFRGNECGIFSQRANLEWEMVYRSTFTISTNEDAEGRPLVQLEGNLIDNQPEMIGIVPFGDTFRIEGLSTNQLMFTTIENDEAGWAHAFVKLD